jgi:ArsR family transcriptional regulator
MARPSKQRTAPSKRQRAHWNEHARLLRVIAHPIRLMILEALSKSSRCVKDLNGLAPVSQPHLSQHMAALRRAKVVQCYSSGTLRCYYILQPTLVQKLLSLLSIQHPVLPRERRQVVREATQRTSAAKKKRKAGISPRRTRTRATPPQ